ncbi:hypothetical protein SeMB42_g02847 [Synchytrium endobioticum]|uniref:Uncharacterized protein n=1 Tax=Synchytrium endobioticum TaxID=286115 RepID=A0A507DC04_9FUNG|nr:hypothetical protein SeMB42_g02847 [Synchytrium endobioticum]
MGTAHSQTSKDGYMPILLLTLLMPFFPLLFLSWAFSFVLLSVGIPSLILSYSLWTIYSTIIHTIHLTLHLPCRKGKLRTTRVISKSTESLPHDDDGVNDDKSCESGNGQKNRLQERQTPPSPASSPIIRRMSQQVLAMGRQALTLSLTPIKPTISMSAPVTATRRVGSSGSSNDDGAIDPLLPSVSLPQRIDTTGRSPFTVDVFRNRSA